jgi:two-component system sensor kinase FixL
MKILHYLRDAAVFAPCYVALDWASYIDPLGPFNITPWNPQAALAIVWMMLGGLAHAPAVLATILLADFAVRHMPGGFSIAFAGAAVLAGGYAAIAWTLHSLLSDTGLRSTRQLTTFAIVVVAGTAVVGAGFITMLDVAGAITEADSIQSWLRFWIGDAVGVLVTAPLLFAASDAERRAALTGLVRRGEFMLQVLVLAGTVWIIFYGLGNDPSRHFYLLFLPLIWIAVRFGLNGAIVATGVVQIGVVLGIHGERGIPMPIMELQALLVALTLTGLFLGVMVDQRQRAEENLRHTLRLAAAGEMAGAIAHEVNQPLTAVTNYGRAAQMLLERSPAGMAQVADIVGKMLSEAERAAEVVRRLRDFFRAGTTRLEPVPAHELLAAARRIAERAIGGNRISLELEESSTTSPLLVDRLQVEVILRNLIDNAVESLNAVRRADGRISLRLRAEGGDSVRIIVEDNGPGVADAMREGLFEPFSSGKSTGMGLGLAVSRAIAQAHGGSLVMVPAAHGEFHLILPCARDA